MMNPSAYGPPPTQQTPMPQQQFQQQQQQPLNGNYQQQLTQSMGGLSMNPMKQMPPMQSPQQQQQTPMPQQPPSSIYANNANNMPPMPPSGGGGGPPLQTQQPHGIPLPSSFSNGPSPQGQLQSQPQQQTQAPPMMVSGGPPTAQPPSMNNNSMNGQQPNASTPFMYPPQPQAIANPMTINSASIPGMPHMPPKAPSQQMPPQGPQGPVTGTQGPPPMSGKPPAPQQSQAPQQQQYQNQPPRPGQIPFPSQPQQPGMMGANPNQMNAGATGGMPPMAQPGMPPMSQPGMPPMSQPGMPPMSQPGMPPMSQPGMPPMAQPGMPPMPQPGMPPMAQPGMPPMPGYPAQPQHPSAYPPQSQQPGNYQQQQQPGYPGQMMPPQPGQPPRPGQGYNQPSMNSGPTGMYQQPQYGAPAQAQRRLDPDQMPNPIQVVVENQRNAGGPFVTNQAGLLPPLVTTKYVVQDQGNSSPRFLRSSMYNIPATADLMKTTAIPFTLIVSPYARIAEGEYEPPIVDFGELGPIRCNRCKAYMSPNMQFVDAGRRFQCLMCKVSTEVPTEYFQHLDHTGQRVDKYERPELVLGTYEFLATKDYCRNNTTPELPAFVFVIDVSYNTIKSGLVHLLCSQVKRVLKHLPVDQGQEKSKMRVGFITYNSTVHFYNIKSSLAQPQMMVVGDVQDMFMPLLDGFLCDPEESEAVIDALMEQIPKMFVDTKETETVLYPAIQAGLEALKASNCAGKLLVFNSSLPTAEAPGKLKNREDRKLLGTDKEKTILTPQCQSYNTLGHECVQNGCSVDMFLFNNSYIDIATIGQVSRLSGGEVYKYTYFQADTDGKRLIEDIIKNVSRPIAFDAVMRVRTSAGIRATDFYGHFFMTNTTDVELASVDANKAIAIEIKHDDKLAPEENVYVQIALLYTSCAGQRRLRILNLALRATNTIADIFKACDLDAIMLFFAKQACVKLMELTPKAVKDTIIHRSAQILACYRRHCTSPTSAGQLILPECLKLLPLYASCLLKNDALSGGSDMTIDDRSYVIQLVLSMDLNISVKYFYPRFIPIHQVDAEQDELPPAIRCTHEKMAEDGAYILENGNYMFVWLGQSLSPTFVQPLFGVQCTQQVNAERFAIVGDNPLAERVRQIIETIMQERSRYMRVTCVRQNDKLESVFRHFLVEDRGTDGSASYVDFLCHMHKEIKDLLS